MAEEEAKYSVGEKVFAFIDGFGVVPAKIVEIIQHDEQPQYEILVGGVQFLVDEDMITREE